MKTLIEDQTLQTEKLSDKSGYGNKETKFGRMAKYSIARTSGGLAGAAIAGAVGVGSTVGTGGGMAGAMGAYYAYRKYKTLKLKAEKETDKIKKNKILTKAQEFKEKIIKLKKKLKSKG
jgi:uncharacterized membrane protein YebE (DUF533 family)